MWYDVCCDNSASNLEPDLFCMQKRDFAAFQIPANVNEHFLIWVCHGLPHTLDIWEAHGTIVEPKSHKPPIKTRKIQLKSPIIIIIIIIIIMIFPYFLRIKEARVLLHPIPSRYGSRLPGTPGERTEGGGPATAGDPGRRWEEENHISRRGSLRRSMRRSTGALVPSQLADWGWWTGVWWIGKCMKMPKLSKVHGKAT